MSVETSTSLECATCPAVLRLVLVGIFPNEPVMVGLISAGTELGWRQNIDTSRIHCGACAEKIYLVCTRCNCRPCFCMGGPRFVARPGEKDAE